MNKLLKYTLLIIVIALLGYKSVYIKKLSALKKGNEKKFDAELFTKELWEKGFASKIDSAVELSELIKAVKLGKDDAFKKYSNALSIGNYRYFLVKTIATVSSVNEDEIRLQLPGADSTMNAVLATEYIYGNAIRDASGLVDIKDFPNSSDLNSISEAMNKIVRNTVLPPFKSTVKKDNKIAVTAAIEINKEHIKWNDLELLPVQLQILP